MSSDDTVDSTTQASTTASAAAPKSQRVLDLEAEVHAELLAVRKATDGLSPASMTQCPVTCDLLADGDPSLAFARLSHRVLETVEQGDDTLGIEAAAYSLGLASKANTHLDRLNDFGEEYGYEARQARRHSDRGLRQLAVLITSNWIVHAVPSVEVFVAEQSDRSFAITVRAKRQWFVDMGTPHLQWQDADGKRWAIPRAEFVSTRSRQPERPGGDADRSEHDGDSMLSDSADQPAAIDSDGGEWSAWTTTRLRRPIRMRPPEPDTPRSLRVSWSGEVWPRFVVVVTGGLRDDTLLTSQSLGNTLMVTVEVAHRATSR